MQAERREAKKNREGERKEMKFRRGSISCQELSLMDRASMAKRG